MKLVSKHNFQLIERAFEYDKNDSLKSLYLLIDNLELSNGMSSFFFTFKKCINQILLTIDKNNEMFGQGANGVDVSKMKYFSTISEMIPILNDLMTLDNHTFLSEELNFTELLNITYTRELSSGEKSFLQLFSSFYYYYLSKDFDVRQHQIIMIDEGDLGFHPNWKKEYISLLLNFFSNLSNDLEDIKFQIIISTHDPLTLSDFYSSNVIFLNKSEEDKTMILSDEKDKPNTFGANIHDLLADSFFLQNGFMGEFAKEKIEETIAFLNWKKLEQLEEKSDNNKDEISRLKAKVKNFDVDYHWNLIRIIGEPIIRERMLKMYHEVFPENKEAKKERLKLLAEELGINVEITDGDN
jgi:hypothetical protein